MATQMRSHLGSPTMECISTVPGLDCSQEQLAELIGDLYYDSRAEFLDLLARKIAAELAGCAEH